MIKRLPLTGTYNTRSSSVNALTSSSGIVGVGIVGSMIVGQASRSSDKDVRYINCFVLTTVDEVAGTKRVKVVKRPGFVVHNTPAAGEKGVAVHVWAGQGAGTKVISAFGVTNSTIYDSTSSLGAITGRCNGITETQVSGTPTLLIASQDSSGWYYQSSLIEITSANYPGNASRTVVGNFAPLDGYNFIMDSTGRIYNSDLNSIAVWTAASYVTANSIPDIGVGVVKHRNTAVGFCKGHFDVFRNAGTAVLSPLVRIEELSQQIGCISSLAITEIRDKIYFAGADSEGVVSIYAYDSGQASIISTPEIDAQLMIAGPANVTLTAGGAYGRHFVIVKASNTTYVHCVEEKGWSEWNSTTPLWSKASGVTSGSTVVCYFVSDVSTSGKVYVFNPASVSFQDAGSAFTASIQTSKWDNGTNRYKIVSRTDVIGDTESDASDLSISWSDDDYVTSSTVRTVDLSATTRKIHRCGRFRRRSFTLSHSANTPMGLEALELEFELGNT